MDDSEVMIVKQNFKNFKQYQSNGHQDNKSQGSYQRGGYQGSGYQRAQNENEEIENDQINEDCAPGQTLRRKPGRPRIERSGRKGRPRKIYNTGQTANINEDQEEYDDDEDKLQEEEPSDDEIFVDAAENENIMELRYVLITLLKILISTPTVLLVYHLPGIHSAALMGGHLDNKNNSTNVTDTYYEYDILDSQELDEKRASDKLKENTESEEIPDPSPLVLPGYNLPENIFNHGKPFYVEKDPLTGTIDFSHKSPSLKLNDDLYEYVDEEPSENIYDKANIDRKDGSLSSHRPSDVNQLTPNFHDFLNLPVKYNPDKYVYPLISSSYASTKIQGSVNKFHNHKDYNMKTTTIKPTGSPTYYSTNNQYFKPTKTTPRTTAITTTTTQKSSTIKKYPEIYLTTKSTNLMNYGMSHPSFQEEFDYYDVPSSTTETPKPSKIYLTTESINNIYLTSKIPTISTTKKTMSLFEQLFGDYDETITTTEKAIPPMLFGNLPSNKYNKNKNDNEIKTEKSSYTTSTSATIYAQYPNAHAGPNILTGTSMGLDNNYDYEEDYSTGKYEDNVAVENKPIKIIDDELKIEPLNVIINKEKTYNKTETNNNNNGGQLLENSFEQQNNTDYYSEYDYQEKDTTATGTSTTTTIKPITSTIATITTAETTSVRATSLPLGENHVTNSNHEPINREPIIVATQNLREKLNSERVLPKPFEKPVVQPVQSVQHTQPPSTSNIHIAPDQDTVSFVVGNHQNVDGGQYIGTSLKESPYDSNPFRPLYGQQATYSNANSVSYSIQAEPEDPVQSQSTPPLVQSYPEVVGSAVTIQPLKNSEASLAIGVPVNSMKQVPGQVVDEKLEINNNPIKFPQDLLPPPRQPQPIQPPPTNREVLKLSSKPVYHQLPSDLTPPKEKEIIPPKRLDHRPIRPPWDPRPGHFYSGKPEYNRPPRPPPEIAYKRIDNLPNILPQFRPNMNKHNGPSSHYYDNRLIRQPLLERPSNRPIGFFEKLQPPPPPPPVPVHNNLQNLRKIPPPVNPPRQSIEETQIAEDRIMNEGPRRPIQHSDQFGFYQTPPQVKIANRRNGEDAIEVETLQMIQAKNAEKNEKIDKEIVPTASQIINIPADDNFKDNTEKTIYKVYPVNTPPIKLDVIDNNKKESVVIGTRSELPLPPSKINNAFIYDQNPLFDPKERNDAPILKPHPRPSSAFPMKSDFPYPLERPDPSVMHPAVPDIPSNHGNDLDEIPNNKFAEKASYLSSNQWNTIGENLESRIVNGQKINAQNSNQISVTLKTYTEKPIAVAYTPTEPNFNADKYSMPNYGSPVIPEIRPGTVENAETGHGNSNNEFTVSVVMHTHPQFGGNIENISNEPHKRMDELSPNSNHKSDIDAANYPKLDFQAPFQASINVDHTINQGWSIVRDKNKTTTEATELTTMSYATTSEFDIENFKPQLEGGFKPIYNLPDEEKKFLKLE
ncbi:hypothetical protein NQ314_003911 [Rhamnusium bicolor]|uniref:Uncharacterized protein n=1 Tax=Rhamnusium bicolor TaxID=1586634 RepID=A0AAV8ZNN0_9CUCU|nr:hypothetical protein NQ314_003911 [Rhamnusium bicolor]